MAFNMHLFVAVFIMLFMPLLVSGDYSKRQKESGITFYGDAADKIIDLLSNSCKCKKKEAEPIDINSCTANRPRDCSELNKKCKTGIYEIFPEKTSKFNVNCDMDQHGGGWTVIQRRMNGKVDFYRDWQSYKSGFGDKEGEFWLGNDHIHEITKQGLYVLRIELEDFENNKKYAEYNKFSVGSESSGYKLELGSYSGTAGDSLSFQNGMKFTTKDKDNDIYGKNCAIQFKGAWWYKTCHYSNLNGLYLKGKHKSFADGINWYHFKGHYYSLKKTTMLIRKA